MKDAVRVDRVTRDDILKLLTDDEVARVATAETAGRLPTGDEYLDLEGLSRGVLRAPEVATPMGRVLPRKAVHEATWSRILGALRTAASPAPPEG